MEIYKRRLILFGLGNYIFNSERSPDVYGPLAYFSAVAYCEFAEGKLAAVHFRPLVLSLDAAAVLERLAQVSRVYGTEVAIEGETATPVLK